MRIDHVVGLFRTYGFPRGSDTAGDFDPPDEPAQIAQGEELLHLIVAEAGPMRIVAEDLGLIPPYVRKTLAALGLPGYKIAQWERAWDAPGQPYIDPMAYPAASLVTTGTHDTDTLAEWWESLDAAERRRFMVDLHLRETEADKDVLSLELLDDILAVLYRSPAELAIIPMQDLFGWKDRINVPGTVDAANWRWRLPFDPARIADNPEISARVADLRALAVSTGRW
jgi:4-alpha-glucanotransferase